jgi:hypothetical protein
MWLGANENERGNPAFFLILNPACGPPLAERSGCGKAAYLPVVIAGPEAIGAKQFLLN